MLCLPETLSKQLFAQQKESDGCSNGNNEVASGGYSQAQDRYHIFLNVRISSKGSNIKRNVHCQYRSYMFGSVALFAPGHCVVVLVDNRVEAHKNNPIPLEPYFYLLVSFIHF